jgi:hypothetical protein
LHYEVLLVFGWHGKERRKNGFVASLLKILFNRLCQVEWLLSLEHFRICKMWTCLWKSEVRPIPSILKLLEISFGRVVVGRHKLVVRWQLLLFLVLEPTKLNIDFAAVLKVWFLLLIEPIFCLWVLHDYRG